MMLQPISTIGLLRRAALLLTLGLLAGLSLARVTAQQAAQPVVQQKQGQEKEKEQEQGEDPALVAALDELKKGRYSAAAEALTRILQAKPGEAGAQRGLLRARLETGRYREAEVEARRFLAAGGGPAIRLLLSEALAATGRYDEALAELTRIGEAEESLVRSRAALRRGEILLMTGREDQAKPLFEGLAKYYEENTIESADELAAIAAALVHLGKYQEANDLYLEAIAEDAESVEAQLGAGELYTAKYNYAEAADFFRDALKVNENSARAHLGVAANKRIGGGDEMNAALARALKINPNYVEARVLAATLDLEAERYSSAQTQIDEALALNPRSLSAHSLRAALFWLQDKAADYEREVAATLAINPRHGELYETLAHFATQTRRYREAVDYLNRAVSLSPRLWSAHLALGIGLLRLGKMEEGRAAIETSFSGDPFNLWAKNTLDLLDTMKEYRDVPSGDFIVRTAPQETEVLGGYAAELLDEAKKKLTERYGFTPNAPITVEIFPNHEDFAVRTLGLPGLGALGVCFGQVIAQDSPSARAGTPFNWGSTLWHEYMHVISLQMTDHRIPRWFSEGLSVYEEHRARPGWGDDWSIEHLRAFVDGKWFRISEIDNGFIRPKRPEDIGLAYFEASQICHFIEDRFGFPAILSILRGYREKKRTPEILSEVLRLSEGDFDREFNAYVRKKMEGQIVALEATIRRMAASDAAAVAALAGGGAASPGAGGGAAANSPEALATEAEARPGDYGLNVRAGIALFGAKKPDEAERFLRRAVELFPYQIGAGNPLELLAKLAREKGRTTDEASWLEALVRIDENNYDALKRLATIRQEAGDKQRALETLRQSFYINPFEHAAHTGAGALLLDAGQAEEAVREYRVALAGKPPNLAESHYNLARALLKAGRKAEAKRSVLQSLELAPSFELAQDLLLEIVEQK